MQEIGFAQTGNEASQMQEITAEMFSNFILETFKKQEKLEQKNQEPEPDKEQDPDKTEVVKSLQEPNRPRKKPLPMPGSTDNKSEPNNKSELSKDFDNIFDAHKDEKVQVEIWQNDKMLAGMDKDSNFIYKIDTELNNKINFAISVQDVGEKAEGLEGLSIITREGNSDNTKDLLKVDQDGTILVHGNKTLAVKSSNKIDDVLQRHSQNPTIESLQK